MEDITAITAMRERWGCRSAVSAITCGCWSAAIALRAHRAGWGAQAVGLFEALLGFAVYGAAMMLLMIAPLRNPLFRGMTLRAAE